MRLRLYCIAGIMSVMTMLQIIEDSIIEIQGVPAILDSDVAALYEVETRELAQAVKKGLA